MLPWRGPSLRQRVVAAREREELERLARICWGAGDLNPLIELGASLPKGEDSVLSLARGLWWLAQGEEELGAADLTAALEGETQAHARLYLSVIGRCRAKNTLKGFAEVLRCAEGLGAASSVAAEEVEIVTDQAIFGMAYCALDRGALVEAEQYLRWVGVDSVFYYEARWGLALLGVAQAGLAPRFPGEQEPASWAVRQVLDEPERHHEWAIWHAEKGREEEALGSLALELEALPFDHAVFRWDMRYRGLLRAFATARWGDERSVARQRLTRRRAHLVEAESARWLGYFEKGSLSGLVRLPGDGMRSDGVLLRDGCEG